MTINITFISTLLIIISPAFSLSLPRSTRTKLSYSNGVHLIETTRSRNIFWSNFFPTKRAYKSQQESVDEYLEFLDHRYNRLRIDEEEPSPTRFSVWGWFTMDSNNKRYSGAQDKQQNDALYDLGIAELALQRLLEKHHLSLNAMLPSSAKTDTNSGGLFGRPKNAPVSTPPYQLIKKQVDFLSEELSKVLKQVLVVVANGVSSLTCFGSVLVLLFVHLMVTLGPIFTEA
mmetsp:Transcript_9975/g.15324  ORF Transcript_9975/g.15324 Transcript_9975/m.15324 type:complete len:230 (-) Transcript_9975:174-863(-)